MAEEEVEEKVPYEEKRINYWMPQDVYETLLELQLEAKKKCNCQKSLQTILHSLVRKEAAIRKEKKED